MSLNDYLLAHPVDGLEREVAVSTRLKDEKGNLIKFKIKPMLQEDYQSYQEQCVEFDKKGKVKFNSKRFNNLLVINHTIDPNFRDSDSIQKAGCRTPEQFMNKVLLSGEIQNLAEQIRITSGFADSIDDLVDEVKN